MTRRFIDSSEPRSLPDAQAEQVAYSDAHYREWHRPKRTAGRQPGESNTDCIARLCGELAAAEHDRDRYRALLAALPTEAAAAGDAGVLARWVLDTARAVGR